MPSIVIFIAIHFINTQGIIIDHGRYSLSKKIFNHYARIIHSIMGGTLSLVVLGSQAEKYIMKETELTDADYEYCEFDQFAFSDKWEMLTVKIRTGMEYLCNNTSADIMLWAGSNDYISFNFFNQLISFYNPLEKQVYGIDNYSNGGNITILSKYDSDANSLGSITCWTGEGLGRRQKYKYIGGIIGLNRALYEADSSVIQRWSYDEGIDEHQLLEVPGVVKMNSTNILFINPKTPTDLTSLEFLLSQHRRQFIRFNNRPRNPVRQFIETELNNFSSL